MLEQRKAEKTAAKKAAQRAVCSVVLKADKSAPPKVEHLVVTTA